MLSVGGGVAGTNAASVTIRQNGRQPGHLSCSEIILAVWLHQSFERHQWPPQIDDGS